MGLAIAAGVVATAVSPRTEGFRRLGPSTAVATLYVLASYSLAQTVRSSSGSREGSLLPLCRHRVRL